MAEQYTVEQLAAKLRQRRPDLAHVTDQELVTKVVQAAPQIGQFLKREMGMPADPNKDLSPIGVAGSQLRDNALGVLDTIGIDTASPVPGTLKNIAVGAMGLGTALKNEAERPRDDRDFRGRILKPMLEAGVEELQRPWVETYEGFTERDWPKAAHGAGGVATSLITAGIAAKNAVTGARKAGFIFNSTPAGQIPKVSAAARLYSKATGATSSLSARTNAVRNFDRAAPFLKREELEFLRDPLGNPRAVSGVEDAVLLGKRAQDRIYNKDIQPFVTVVEEVDWSPVADKLKSSIPDTFTAEERLAAEKIIDEKFSTRTMTGEQAERFRQKLRAQDQVNKIQAKNPSDQAAIEKTEDGWAHLKSYEAARDHLVDVVKKKTGQDIGDALSNFGSVKDVTNEISTGIPIDMGLLDRVEGAYITGGMSNLKGQATRVVGGILKSGDRRIRQAFAAIPKTGIPMDSKLSIFTGPKLPKGSQIDLLPMDSPTRPLLALPVEKLSLQDRISQFVSGQADLKRRQALWESLDPRKPEYKGQLELIPDEKGGLFARSLEHLSKEERQAAYSRGLQLWKDLDPRKQQPKGQLNMFPGGPENLFPPMDLQTPKGVGVASPDNPKLGFRGTVKIP